MILEERTDGGADGECDRRRDGERERRNEDDDGNAGLCSRRPHLSECILEHRKSGQRRPETSEEANVGRRTGTAQNVSYDPERSEEKRTHHEPHGDRYDEICQRVMASIGERIRRERRHAFPHAEHDTDEFRRQSLAFAEAARRAGKPCDVLCMSGSNHFAIVEQLAREGSALHSAILRHFSQAEG